MGEKSKFREKKKFRRVVKITGWRAELLPRGETSQARLIRGKKVCLEAERGRKKDVTGENGDAKSRRGEQKRSISKGRRTEQLIFKTGRPGLGRKGVCERGETPYRGTINEGTGGR